MTVSEQDRKEIAAVIEQYRRGFAEMNVEMIKGIWDQNYENIIYIVQEKAQPMRGWTDVEQYYNHVAELLEWVKTMTIEDLSLDVFGDFAYAFCVFHFEGDMKGQSQLHIRDERNTFILHRKGGTWKVIHYHESAPGPLP